MKPTRLLFCLAVAFVTLLAGAAPAQRNFHPEKFDRATRTDSEGYVQWDEHKEVKCPNCSGTGRMKCTTCERFPDEVEKCPDCDRGEKGAKNEAVCHACAGEGKFPDPLEKVLCPGCLGAGWSMCGTCPGGGVLRVGAAKRYSKCPGCRGEGAIKCGVCKGKRLVATVPTKPPIREADVETLEKILAATEETLKAVERFVPKGKKTRKEVKEFAKILKGAQKTHPPLKPLQKHMDQLMKTTYGGSNFQGQSEREAFALERIKRGAVYYLQHQQRIQTLALERAKKNAELEGGKK